jgi:enoyl-CoA hydratase/carnithine racemase
VSDPAGGSPAGEVAVSRDGQVCLIQLRRERKLNALSSHLESELDRALDTDQARDSGCIVITGVPRAFSAGADLGEQGETSAEAIMAYYRSAGRVYERVAALPQLTVAAISGWCLGGGLELALACDFRVASESATFGLPEVEIGIIPSSGGTMRLTRAVGPARAKELVLARSRWSAGEALAMGLITQVVEGDPVPAALELAGRLAALPRLAASLAKQAIDAVPGSSRDAALLIERLTYAALAQGDEHSQTVERFSN